MIEDRFSDPNCATDYDAMAVVVNDVYVTPRPALADASGCYHTGEPNQHPSFYITRYFQ